MLSALPQPATDPSLRIQLPPSSFQPPWPASPSTSSPATPLTGNHQPSRGPPHIPRPSSLPRSISDPSSDRGLLRLPLRVTSTGGGTPPVTTSPSSLFDKHLPLFLSLSLFFLSSPPDLSLCSSSLSFSTSHRSAASFFPFFYLSLSPSLSSSQSHSLSPPPNLTLSLSSSDLTLHPISLFLPPLFSLSLSATATRSATFLFLSDLLTLNLSFPNP